MPKSQVGSFVSLVIIIGLLSLLFTYFLYCFVLFIYVDATFLRVSLLLIGILLLRPDESIKTSDSY